VELGAVQRRVARPGQGRGKGAVLKPCCRAVSGIAGRMASAHLGEGDCRGEGRSHGRGPVGAGRAGLLAACDWQASLARRLAAAAPRRDRTRGR
jgi:hypothetical protein